MSTEDSQTVRADVDALLRKAYPQGLMAPAFDIQKSHLAEVFPRLKTRLLKLDDANIGYERDPLGGGGWAAGDGRLPSGPSAPGSEHPSSYYLFFLGATAEPCRASDETLTLGYSVALSVMAPVALVVLNHIEKDDDDFSHSVPEINAEDVETDSGEVVEIDRFCRQTLSPEGLAGLERLHGEITGAVEEFGFLVLPEAEQGKPIPWLQVPMMPFARPSHLTVRDALFFLAMAAG